MKWLNKIFHWFFSHFCSLIRVDQLWQKFVFRSSSKRGNSSFTINKNQRHWKRSEKYWGTRTMKAWRETFIIPSQWRDGNGKDWIFSLIWSMRIKSVDTCGSALISLCGSVWRIVDLCASQNLLYKRRSLLHRRSSWKIIILFVLFVCSDSSSLYCLCWHATVLYNICIIYWNVIKLNSQ